MQDAPARQARGLADLGVGVAQEGPQRGGQAIASDTPWIVCGDFNAESQDEVLERFRLAGFLDPHEHAGPTCSANGRYRRIVFLLYGPGLVGEAVPGAALSDGMLLPSLEMPSHHVPIRARFDRSTSAGSSVKITA